MLRPPQFNIFFPDLVGSEAPSYKLEKDPNSTKENPMAVIRFTAPKPYQDIGFRIIDKPWDRKRTRIVYDRGILQYVLCVSTSCGARHLTRCRLRPVVHPPFRLYFQFAQKFYKK
jgi:hypothetical protein